MVSTDSAKSSGVDTSPIVVTEIVVDGRCLVAREPLRYEVTFDDNEDEPLYELEGPFDMYLFAETRELLIDVLYDTLEVFWRDFATGDPAGLTGAAQRLGQELRERFVGDLGAA